MTRNPVPAKGAAGKEKGRGGMAKGAAGKEKSAPAKEKGAAGNEKERGGIQSLERAFAILDEIAVHRDGITLAELCKSVGPYRVGERMELVRKGALDTSRAKSELGYVPRFPIRKGLEANIAARRAELA